MQNKQFFTMPNQNKSDFNITKLKIKVDFLEQDKNNLNNAIETLTKDISDNDLEFNHYKSLVETSKKESEKFRNTIINQEKTISEIKEKTQHLELDLLNQNIKKANVDKFITDLEKESKLLHLIEPVKLLIIAFPRYS